MSKQIKKLDQKIEGKTVQLVKDSTFTIDERQELLKLIGVGAQGIVVSALDRQTNTKVAIKKIPKAFEDLVDAKRIFREILLLNFFQHENIVPLIDIQRPPNSTNYDDIYFVTGLMETDLHRVIYSNQSLSEEHIQQFVYQLLRGVKQMHSCNVIHRDLKPSNLLLNKKCDLQICDFGLSRGYELMEQTNTGNMTEQVVTRWQRAPEVILNAKKQNEKLDVWSIGCILAEILGKQPLLPGNDYLDQVNKIVSTLGTPTEEQLGFIANESAKKQIRKLKSSKKVPLKSLFPKASAQCLDLLDRMLKFSPNERYSVINCINHPWFEELRSKDEEETSSTPFDWSVDDFEPTKHSLQKKIQDISLIFHPITKDDKDNVGNKENDRQSQNSTEMKEKGGLQRFKEALQQSKSKNEKWKNENEASSKEKERRVSGALVSKNLLNNQGAYSNPYQKSAIGKK